jgi:hypothetical protein
VIKVLDYDRPKRQYFMIKKILSISYCTFLFAFLISACSSSMPNQQATHRTYYESLDLSTPEDAVITFTNAFQKSDFPTVFLVLSPYAQFQFSQTWSLLDYPNLVRVSPSFDPRKNTPPLFKIAKLEHLGETSYYFDILMMAAKEHSAFLIDLGGAVTIQNSIPSSQQECIDVIASVVGIDGNVTFRTIQSPSGRWRVLQVIAPGGDEKRIPWSTPTQSVP